MLLQMELLNFACLQDEPEPWCLRLAGLAPNAEDPNRGLEDGEIGSAYTRISRLNTAQERARVIPPEIFGRQAALAAVRLFLAEGAPAAHRALEPLSALGPLPSLDFGSQSVCPPPTFRCR